MKKFETHIAVVFYVGLIATFSVPKFYDMYRVSGNVACYKHDKL